MMMTNNNQPIGSVKVKQILFLAVILMMLGLICFNLSLFLPSVLGAITLYIITRKYNLYLQEQLRWKQWLSATTIIIGTLVILVLPLYFAIDFLVDRLGNATDYMAKFNVFIDQVHDFVYQKLSIDILSKENLDKLKDIAGAISTTALSTTFNTFTIIVSMYFILYFMLNRPRLFERLLQSSVPLKNSNVVLLGDKVRKMVVANAIGIPVVAVGQGVIALVGYYIFGAPSPILLFFLTALASMIPIVGAAIVYVPVCLFMIAQGDVGAGIALVVYCFTVVGLTDNLLRFTLLKKIENIHPLNTVFGIILGLNLFGFMGLIFGPILISITILLLQVYRDEFVIEDKKLVLPPEEEGG